LRVRQATEPTRNGAEGLGDLVENLLSRHVDFLLLPCRGIDRHH
jgi:hypothetical protein